MHKYTGPHDYFNDDYVDEWAFVANSRRPFRDAFFAAFISELKMLEHPGVLDIGSGPGFLAARVLTEGDVASYHLFDFSPRMIELSRERLDAFGDKTVFHKGSFLEDGWWRSLPGPFDAIVSLQAVHEVRESSRIPRLYGELGLLLRPGGTILIADEVNEANKQEEHLLTRDEHQAALTNAGFESVRIVYEEGDLAMFGGSRT